MSSGVFIEKLHLRKFRSIRSETISFDNPLFLVGQNGSGKSNVVSAFAFLAECVSRPLSDVMLEGGGTSELLYRDYASPNDTDPMQFAMRVDFRLKGDERHGFYVFSPGLPRGVGFEGMREQCVITNGKGQTDWFDRQGARFESNVEGLKPFLDPMALALPVVGGVDAFAPLLRALLDLRVYAIEPNRIRSAQQQDANPFLKHNGSNLVSILDRVQRQDERALDRVRELLGVISSSGHGIDLVHTPDGRVVLVFENVTRSKTATGSAPLFFASAVSDGTLRALGLIVAAMQDPMPSLIAIEEPEANIHPGALGAIADLIEMAARRTQVVVTTHSPDLLDAKWIRPENLRLVTWEDGVTRVADLGTAPKRALQEHLMGAGELLRANALDAAPLPEQRDVDAADLFDTVPA